MERVERSNSGQDVVGRSLSGTAVGAFAFDYITAAADSNA
jgi:hypothetical protein